MPVLSSRIYRPASVSDEAPRSTIGRENRAEAVEAHGWTWDAAEDRLRAAYDRGGVGEWAECALRELEAEEKLERTRRGL